MPKVVEWYLDTTIISIVLIICTILTIITFRALRSNQISGNKLLRVFSIQIYVVFTVMIGLLVISLLRIISLPIIGGNGATQQRVCDIENTLQVILFAMNHLSIDLLLITRLKKVFNNSSLKLSKCVFYSYSIIFMTIWCIWMFVGSYLMIFNGNGKPYNIYTESIDTDGNGTTCSLSAQQSKGMKVVLVIAMLAIIFGNLTIWILFMRKLFQLLYFTNQFNYNASVRSGSTHDATSVTTTNQSETEVQPFQMDFINLMKDQTMLVSVWVLGTFLSYIITMMFSNSIGQFAVMANHINVLLTIFLSFKFNRYYFKLLHCNKCSAFCCKCFERFVAKKMGFTDNSMSMTNDEIILADTVGNSTTSKPSNLQASNTNQSTDITDHSAEVPHLTVDVTEKDATTSELTSQMTPVNSKCN